MREEVMQILKMLEEGKINADQAAQLMEAGNLSPVGGNEQEMPAGKAKWLKVRVYDMASQKKKVNVSVPLSLVSVGLKLGMKFGLDKDELKGFNFDEIIQLIQAGAEGKLVDVVDEDTGEQVEVYVE